jgi:fatty acid desaturase
MNVKELSQADPVSWLLRAALNWLEITIIFVSMALVDNWLFHVIGIFILGTRQLALALLGHEAIHKNISKHLGLNNFLGSTLASLPLFQTLNFFKKFHLDHHAYLQTDKDPEIKFRAKYPSRWKVPFMKFNLLKLFLTDLTGVGYLEAWHALMLLRHNLTIADLFIPLFFWTAVCYGFSSINMGWIPLYWFIAFVTSYWAMFRQRALVEHLGTDETHKIKANYLQRFLYLPHNTSYHYEHHVYPNVPCWNLPKIRENEEGVLSVSELFKKLERKNF